MDGPAMSDGRGDRESIRQAYMVSRALPITATTTVTYQLALVDHGCDNVFRASDGSVEVIAAELFRSMAFV